MFVHGGFWHLALNMYTLYLFGPRIERAWSGRRVRSLLHPLRTRRVVCASAIRAQRDPVRRSAAVLGVMLAYAMRWPDDEIYLFGVMPLRVKWTVAMLLRASSSLREWPGPRSPDGSPDGVAYLAHLGRPGRWLAVSADVVGDESRPVEAAGLADSRMCPTRRHARFRGCLGRARRCRRSTTLWRRARPRSPTPSQLAADTESEARAEATGRATQRGARQDLRARAREPDERRAPDPEEMSKKLERPRLGQREAGG